MNLPTFVIAGAPRSGTTYLYNMLDRHPDVFMAKPQSPEPKFFLVDAEYERGLEYYSRKYFTHASGCKSIGEKSSNYLENATTAYRIHRDLPHVKLIFILRNPIDRAFSNYLWSRQNGLETFSFEKAVSIEATREADYKPEQRYSRPFSYISRGRYLDLLSPYLALFVRAQLKVVFLEDIEATPTAVMDDLCAYLDVEPLGARTCRHARVNSARVGDEAMADSLRSRLRELFHEPNRRLGQLLGRDLTYWR
jgi:hypothetical protein